jgi:hypothetical protein
MAVLSTDSEILDNSNTENTTPPTNSIDLAHGIDFTFRASSIAALDSEVDVS